ncbi:hypothetical protein Cpir12675_006201 [Ceratocystis pirilliformis]|uniref:Cobalamin-independent methionine synthase MetE C-terminal/archaeal domain-containing protein n=1 Tax=Ceratocystis pirilliformis TaxID=259994 RepID=A0ABR3YLV2_9PEZI
MVLPAGVYRADHVGSFLRPKEVLAAREQVNAGTLTIEGLRTIEDKHIAELVAKQAKNGIQSITDGEFRRAFFHIDFLQHIGGCQREGSLQSTNVTTHGMKPPRVIIVDKISHPTPIQVADYAFASNAVANLPADLASRVSNKVCIPSPTMLHFRGARDCISEAAYPEIEPAFFDDVARVYQQELADLYAAGCRFVQLDDTNLAYLCDSGMRAEAETRHGDASALTRRYAALINAAISQRPADMKIGIHLCRGNFRSQWFAQGGYEPVAEVLFRDLNVDVYFLEYDDARSGDFSPLRFLPEKKIVVLGVMSSKIAGLDDKEDIVKRLHEAAKFCPRGLDQLCLSHQCGFSSTHEGNDLTEEQQWAKVRLEVAIAKQVWGEDLSK